MMGHYGDGMGFGWFGMASGWVFTIVVWALIIWAIVAFVHWATRQQGGTDPKKKTAIEILEERYARGEISKEEFEERKKVLQGQSEK
jgi:putative membrane protein